MAGIPPPPPPPPIPGFANSGPPPPPPPPGRPSNASAVSNKSPPTATKDRGALLTDITKGTRLKKTVTNDRSAPAVGGTTSNSSAPSIGIAPQVPNGGRPSNALATPIPGGTGVNRVRSNSDSGGSGASAQVEEYNSVPKAPQLGGIFAGVGIPKLRKTGGGIDTGRDSSYASEPETLRFSAPKPPISSVPVLGALRPSLQNTESSPTQPSNPLISNLRKPPLRPANRPNSEIDSRSKYLPSEITPPRANPLPPGTLKPPPPPVTSRKSSTPAPPIPRSSVTLHAAAPPPPSTIPPRPPPSITTTSPAAPSNPAPRPPAPALVPSNTSVSQRSSISASRTPPNRSIPLPPAFMNSSLPNENAAPSLAMQAARNAFGSGQASPAQPPPPPPPPPPPLTPPPLSSKQLVPLNHPSASPSPPISRPHPQQPSKSMLDPSSYTLSNGNISHHVTQSNMDTQTLGNKELLRIEDSRWRFQDESQLPKPREFVGASKLYRAGRGSSVPLDLSLFC